MLVFKAELLQVHQANQLIVYKYLYIVVANILSAGIFKSLQVPALQVMLCR